MCSVTAFLLYTQLMDFLASKPSLHKLDLNGCTGVESVPYLHQRRQALSQTYVNALNEWHARCPTLRHVVFPNGSIWSYRGKWRCQNELACSRNRIVDSDIDWKGGVEPWGGSMFEKDLRRDWPDNVIADIKFRSNELM